MPARSSLKKSEISYIRDESRRYVVPSAPGKRFPDDTKVTDMLYACYAAAEEGKDFSEQLAKDP